MKHYKSVEFLSIFRVSSLPRTNAKPPTEKFLAMVMHGSPVISMLLNKFCTLLLYKFVAVLNGQVTLRLKRWEVAFK